MAFAGSRLVMSHTEMALPESLSSIQKAVQLTTDQRETKRPPIA